MDQGHRRRRVGRDRRHRRADHGPCALPAINVLCVGASDEYDRKASFSNYGSSNVDVFAPGTAILSTYLSPAYQYLQGTSMASPNTAAVAALVLSARPA